MCTPCTHGLYDTRGGEGTTPVTVTAACPQKKQRESENETNRRRKLTASYLLYNESTYPTTLTTSHHGCRAGNRPDERYHAAEHQLSDAEVAVGQDVREHVPEDAGSGGLLAGDGAGGAGGAGAAAAVLLNVIPLHACDKQGCCCCCCRS